MKYPFRTKYFYCCEVLQLERLLRKSSTQLFAYKNNYVAG